MKLKRGKRFWLILALVFMAVSMIATSAIQSNGGKVKVETLDMVVADGAKLHARVFIPEDASADHKLPLVVCQHGSQHNLEMQDMNYIELARRGFIVISGDAFGHGSSSPRSFVSPAMNFSNMVYEIEYAVNNLDCVDENNIGIVGHSMGAAIVTSTLSHYVEQEARGTGPNRIKAALEIGYDPDKYEAYSFEGIDHPVYADSNWGVIAGKYDEYFFRQPDGDNNPANILKTQAALNWVRQADPNAQGPVEEGHYYEGEINGKKVCRVYYQNPEIHPMNVFSVNTSRDVTEFFYNTLGVPDGHTYIDPSNQVWLWKQIFAGLGLAGVILFLFPFAQWIMDTVPFFSTLKAEKQLPRVAALKTSKQKRLYWLGWIVNTALPPALAMPIMHYWIGKQSFAPMTVTKWFGEGATNEIAVWACINGILLISLFVLYNKAQSKQAVVNEAAWGYRISVSNLFKSLLLAFITFCVVYLIDFFADYAFKTDFRFWLIAMRVFNMNKVLYWIAYVPAFIIFYLANSLLVEGGSRFEDWPEWKVTLLSCLSNFIGITVLISIQYIVYINTGTFVFNAMRTHNLFPFVVLVPIATLVQRRFFKETGSIYLGSFTIAMLYTMMQVTQVSMNTGLIQ